MIGFSVSYENDYLHLLQMLALARIPLLAAERDERYPLILVGGAVTYINPEPLADFVDLMVIGDGEETIHDYLDLAARHARPTTAGAPASGCGDPRGVCSQST